jgi:hypothetical protein
MKTLAWTAALGAACLGLGACGSDADKANNSAGTEADGNGTAMVDGARNGSEGGSAAADPNWPRGTRIVEENGVTYRVDPNGTRVQITADGPRIVVENGTRYRVRPDGTRVRIDETGVDVDLDGPDVPGLDVDVGTNRKGNLDIDVNTQGGDASPNR